ncbi:MAG: hypothetical protein BWX57_01145 [Tenericutes bacterium ADurb.Bin024]|jgi:hypothetical protein|nr:hypothetical protein [Patescibacteria group bacterium]OQC48908.1 MAG: hypothetical protein BWX57_01145 [Tenericutes bacterium ADurb.Bin024]
MNQVIIIREIEDNDYENIATFYSTFSDDSKTKEFWIIRLRQWWDENPAYKYGHPRGVIAQVDGKIIGITCNFPTRMIWEGKPQIVINGSSWKVLPEYRKFSMDIWEKHREITKDYIMFNTTPNSFVRKLLITTKQQEFIVSKSFYYYFGHPQSIFRSTPMVVIAFFSKILVKSLVNLSIFIRKDIQLQNKSLDNVKDKIDNLWVEHRNDFLYTNIRDSNYLRWISKSKEILYVYKHNELQGFLILDKDPRKKIVILVDYWSKNLMEDAKHIIKNLLSYYKDMNLVIPSFCPKLEYSARGYFLVRRKKSNIGFIICSKQITINFDKSFLCMLQGDYGM